MELRKTINVTRMSELIIGNVLIFILLFNTLYGIIYNVIDEFDVDNLIKLVICLIIQFIFIFIICKISISIVFINNTIKVDDISKLTRNIVLALIAICVINFLYSLVSVDSQVMEMVESDYRYMLYDSYLKTKFSEEYVQKYEIQLNELIDNLKKEMYITTTIVESIKTVIYLSMIPIIKKSIKNGVRKE